jgi:hypothetical protein
LLPARARGNVAVSKMLDRAERTVPSGDAIAGKTILYVNPAAVPLAAYIPLLRAARGERNAVRQRWLATATTDVLLERVDDRTLRIEPEGGYWIAPPSRLFRSPQHPMRVGEVVDLTGVRFEIAELTDDGRPSVVMARFDADLEDPSLIWLRWSGAGYAPFEVPRIGARVVLPRANFFALTE